MLECQTVLTAKIKDDEIIDCFLSTHKLKMGHEVIDGKYKETCGLH